MKLFLLVLGLCFFQSCAYSWQRLIFRAPAKHTRFMSMEGDKEVTTLLTDVQQDSTGVSTEIETEHEIQEMIPEKIDPKDAMKELGKLLEIVKEIQTDGPSWSAEKLTEKRSFFVKAYVRVFAPAIAFSGTQLLLTLGAFAVYLMGLNFSGTGYTNLQNLGSSVPFVGDAIATIEPSWGNAAIALLLAEISAPVLIPIGAILTPRATEALEGKLVDWGLDADGINKKLGGA